MFITVFVYAFIINIHHRFSRDMETVDGLLPFTIRSWLSTAFNVVATVIIISYSTPVFLSVVIPLFIIYYLIQVSYSITNRYSKS